MFHLLRTPLNEEHRNYGTQNTGGTPAEYRNDCGMPQHWRKNETLAEQSEYHGTYEKSSRITEQQENTKKYYQYRTTTY